MTLQDSRAHRRALLLMLVAPLMWSIAGVVTRNLSPEIQAQGRFEITFWRSLFAALCVGLYLAFVQRDFVGAVRRAGRAGMLSGSDVVRDVLLLHARADADDGGQHAGGHERRPAGDRDPRAVRVAHADRAAHLDGNLRRIGGHAVDVRRQLRGHRRTSRAGHADRLRRAAGIGHQYREHEAPAEWPSISCPRSSSAASCRRR